MKGIVIPALVLVAIMITGCASQQYYGPAQDVHRPVDISDFCAEYPQAVECRTVRLILT